ncbi:MAG: isopentenyl phosphate kinase [Candidatus Woesebacteria bacterium]|nr:isopentenyl phosphate kinase [Candidatus Woesebacteria bacterium]
MENLILVKLGGSVITDKKKDFTVREKNILRLAREIKSALKNTNTKIIIGHGAGSFAHVPAAKYRTKEGLINRNSLYGMAVTEDAARKLNSIVIENFLSLGLPAFSFSPASFLISDAKVYSKSYLDPVNCALKIGIIPVVYGDVILDKVRGCTIFSTEKILSILAKELQKDYKIKVIYVTDVDGVYDEKGKTIPVITNKNFDQMKSSILGAKRVDVTGGMLHKVEEALVLAKKYKIETIIINGNKKGNLTSALLGEKVLGTKILV